jgi:hypothetical protein
MAGLLAGGLDVLCRLSALRCVLPACTQHSGTSTYGVSSWVASYLNAPCTQAAAGGCRVATTASQVHRTCLTITSGPGSRIRIPAVQRGAGSAVTEGVVVAPGQQLQHLTCTCIAPLWCGTGGRGRCGTAAVEHEYSVQKHVVGAMRSCVHCTGAVTL